MQVVSKQLACKVRAPGLKLGVQVSGFLNASCVGAWKRQPICPLCTQMLSGSCFGMEFGHLTGDSVAKKPVPAPPVKSLGSELWTCTL